MLNPVDESILEGIRNLEKLGVTTETKFKVDEKISFDDEEDVENLKGVSINKQHKTTIEKPDEW